MLEVDLDRISREPSTLVNNPTSRDGNLGGRPPDPSEQEPQKAEWEKQYQQNNEGPRLRISIGVGHHGHGCGEPDRNADDRKKVDDWM